MKLTLITCALGAAGLTPALQGALGDPPAPQATPAPKAVVLPGVPVAAPTVTVPGQAIVQGHPVPAQAPLVVKGQLLPDRRGIALAPVVPGAPLPTNRVVTGFRVGQDDLARDADRLKEEIDRLRAELANVRKELKGRAKGKKKESKKSTERRLRVEYERAAEMEAKAQKRRQEMEERRAEMEERRREVELRVIERREEARERANERREEALERREEALERAEEIREEAMERAEEARDRAEQARERAAEMAERARVIAVEQLHQHVGEHGDGEHDFFVFEADHDGEGHDHGDHDVFVFEGDGDEDENVVFRWRTSDGEEKSGHKFWAGAVKGSAKPRFFGGQGQTGAWHTGGKVEVGGPNTFNITVEDGDVHIHTNGTSTITTTTKTSKSSGKSGGQSSSSLFGLSAPKGASEGTRIFARVMTENGEDPLCELKVNGQSIDVSGIEGLVEGIAAIEVEGLEGIVEGLDIEASISEAIGGLEGLENLKGLAILEPTAQHVLL
ncbi:MAG: hypothetical protein AAGG01_22015 [Planctomycetota bacterium]